MRLSILLLFATLYAVNARVMWKTFSRMCATGIVGLIPLTAIAVGDPSDLSGMDRFVEAKNELLSLDKDWDGIVSRRGGDGIRKGLGTVYGPPKCLASLCNFNSYLTKFVRSTEGANIDLSEFEPSSLALQQSLTNADFLAYSANFADYGNGGMEGGSKELLSDARKQVKLAIAAMDECISVIKAAN